VSFRKPRIAILLAAASATLLLQAPAALAINFGDMMSPGRWMGGNNDYDDYYDNRGYGYGPPPGAYGVPPYGAPYGAYGAPPYGGAYGAPYGAPPTWTPPANPAPAPSLVTTPPPAARAAPAAPSAKSNEIDALKRRIEELEARKAPPAYAPSRPAADRGANPSPAAGSGNPNAPAPSPSPSPPNFRPMDKF
jgi:hypothetical protein